MSDEGRSAGDAASHSPLAQEADEERSGLAGVASSIADAASPVADAVEQLTSGARRMIGQRSGGRVRRVRQMGRRPLANLWDAHPEARRAALRELGLRIVAVDEIIGTAVEGSAQRGGDFLPLRQLRGQDWHARWQRIRQAVDRLTALPPVDLLKFGDGYWVVDGHNRIAAALYAGQVAVDANVVELRLPGMPSKGAVGNLAPFLEGSRDIREAGRGRLTRTTSRPDELMPRHPSDEHHDDDQRDAQPAGAAE